MFANAAELVTRTDSIPVTRLFAQALMKMTSGELDQDAAAFDVGKDIQNYFWRISGKTASLFSTATEGGAVVAGCEGSVQESLRIYGYNLGMAFQIVDDVLDFTGEETVMGKPAGSDLREGTVTLPGLLLLERYPQENPIKRYFAARRGRDKRVREERLQEAIAMVRSTEVLELSMEFANDYVTRALAAIEGLPATDARATLRGLGSHVLTRRS
jgi:geranylgeranyl pyrophosphate synthase